MKRSKVLAARAETKGLFRRRSIRGIGGKRLLLQRFEGKNNASAGGDGGKGLLGRAWKKNASVGEFEWLRKASKNYKYWRGRRKRAVVTKVLSEKKNLSMGGSYGWIPKF